MENFLPARFLVIFSFISIFKPQLSFRWSRHANVADSFQHHAPLAYDKRLRCRYRCSHTIS
jgi:hypothetical protein